LASKLEKIQAVREQTLSRAIHKMEKEKLARKKKKIATKKKNLVQRRGHTTMSKVL